MTTIETNSNKAGRKITLNAPEVLDVDNVSTLIQVLGEDLVLAKVKAQLTIDFRSMVRGLLESGNIEEGEFTHSDDAIIAMDFTDWKPELRVRKSKEERAAEAMKGMTPDQIKAALALLEAEA